MFVSEFICFFLRLFECIVKEKVGNGYGNMYVNEVYCIGFGEEVIEI